MGTAMSEQFNVNVYLGQGLKRPSCSFCQLEPCCNLLQAFFNPEFVPSMSSFEQFSIGCLQIYKFFLSLILHKTFQGTLFSYFPDGKSSCSQSLPRVFLKEKQDDL